MTIACRSVSSSRPRRGALRKANRAVVPAVYESAKSTYYRLMGWDPETGIPTADKLEALGVGWAAAMLPATVRAILSKKTGINWCCGRAALARADLVREQLEQCGIEYIVWLPESEARFLYDAISTSKIRLVQVCHEEETMGVYAGLHLAGKRAAVLIQNTGLFHSLDALRGMILNLRLPLLLLVGYRGYRGMVEGRSRSTRPQCTWNRFLTAWGSSTTSWIEMRTLRTSATPFGKPWSRIDRLPC